MTALATPPAAERRAHPASRRVLVVVDDACTAPELCASVRAFAGDSPVEALVLAPAHDTVSTQWYLDEEAARADATRRLRTCVSCLAREGIRAGGELSDPDPIQGIGDALREFPADEILLVTTAHRPSRWLRHDVVARAHHAFRQPVTRIVAAASSIPPSAGRIRLHHGQDLQPPSPLGGLKDGNVAAPPTHQRLAER